MVACNASGQINTKATSVADMEEAQAALAEHVVEGHLRGFPSGEQGIIKSVGGLHNGHHHVPLFTTFDSPRTVGNAMFGANFP